MVSAPKKTMMLLISSWMGVKTAVMPQTTTIDIKYR